MTTRTAPISFKNWSKTTHLVARAGATVVLSLTFVSGLVACGDETPRVDTSTDGTTTRPIDEIKEGLSQDERKDLEDALQVLMAAGAEESPLGGLGVLSDPEGARRRLRDRIDGLSAHEIIEMAQPFMQERERSSLEAKASALRSWLQTVRTQIELYALQHNGALPPLDTEGWTPLVGEYLRSPPENPFSPDPDSGIRIGSASDQPGPDLGWAYDSSNDIFRAVISHDVAVMLELVPEGSAPGAPHPDFTTYQPE